MQTAATVNITLCLDDADGAQHQSETSLFHRQWLTRRKLREVARSISAEVCETELAVGRRFGPLLGHVEKRFFDFPPRVFTGDEQGLTITEAANRRIEVEGIARDIIRLCRQEGYRWRDIAILLRDDAGYGELVSTILTDYDIPFFSDQHIQPVHHPLAELIRSALETVAGRWNYDAVFRCFKTDLFMIDRTEIDELENYVLEFGIRGSRWKNTQPWAFVRRFSLDEDAELSTGQASYLNRINHIRNRAAAPLIAFESQIRTAATAAEMTTALYNFLTEINVPQTLEKWADAAEVNGDLEQAREHRQIWNSVIDLFDQLVEACDHDELKLDDYSAIINDGLEGLKLSLIPPGLDHVTVSPLDQTSVANVRAVYLPGVNDGILPMRARGEGLLTDAERLRIAAVGLELAPGALADTFAERFMIYTALTRSKDYLWVSYALADEEGKGLSPSLVISRLKELSSVKVKSLPLEPMPGTEHDYIAHRRSSLSALATGLRLYKSGQEISNSWWDVYNWAVRHDEVKPLLSRTLAGLFHHNQEAGLPAELAGKLYGPSKKLRGSVTRFESFRACPFRHFSQYGLSLKERAIFRLNAPDLGQFLHTALKNFGDMMQAADRDWGSVADNEYQQLCADIVGELAPKLQNEILLSSEQHKHLLKRLTNTVERSVRRLVEFDRASQFKPRVLEKSFGRGESALPPLVYQLPDGTDLEIVGQIDRLDAAEHDGRQYVLVIDYKSGGAWLKLVDVYHGLKLQLLTYLLVAQSAAEELLGSAECQPAGILYYFLKNPTVTSKNALSDEEAAKEINNQLKMPGWTLADPEIAKVIDNTLDPRSEFLKLALKKDGSFYGNCQAYIKTADEFSLLLNHVEKVLVETADNIMAGDITISPYALERRSPCGICSYLPVCQFDLLLPENDYRKLQHYDDDVIIRALAEKKGGGEG
ncbi:ATP-dependent helicase/deoxyribonuclease subunit B [bioreactor metagenome]|uniref:ATP-dependent helicase/deoxyribonuclease subunit B n=1 Tax=bioreactor metagenome TaxID=1076179 RepID=A0A644ZHT9_9ZZZZ